MATKKILALRLAEARANRGLSVADVATQSKISRQFLHELERGTYNPTVDVARRLADVLGVTLDWLTGR